MKAAAATHEKYITAEVAEARALVEVNQIRQHLRPDGTLPPDAMQDIEADYSSMVQEMAMPGAVTNTMQRVETELDDFGRSKRVIKWLGKSAIDVAMSGYQFYVSEAGAKRGDIEVAEARYSQDNLDDSHAKIFISPKMSQQDGSVEVAKAERVYDEDSVRVSYAVKDKNGAIVGRRIASLLVSDIPLASWMAMLRDPNNLFGKALAVRDAQSALSVMELFRELNLPEEQIPEGPVTIVEAVLPYIDDPVCVKNVSRQIERFRNDQATYREQAEKTAHEWLQFDLELARSLERGTATRPIEGFIASLQHNWGETQLEVIKSHDVAGEYIMTTELAAVLEDAQRNLLVSVASLTTDNDKVLQQVDRQTAQALKAEIGHLEAMRRNQMAPAQIAMQEARVRRMVAGQNIKGGGGCAGSTSSSFKNGESSDGGDYEASGRDNMESSENTASWTWKKGVCRVDKCPSPNPTDVGPCSVCRSCQAKFDRGQDPTASGTSSEPRQSTSEDPWSYLNSLLMRNVERTSKNGERSEPEPAEVDVAQQIDEIFDQRADVMLTTDVRKMRQSKVADAAKLVVAGV